MALKRKTVFVDTSAFKALIDENDDFHDAAVKTWKNLRAVRAELLTSNFILDECYTLVRMKCGLKKSQKLRSFLSDLVGEIRIMRVGLEDELNAWKWFDLDWSGLSFTDCTCFSMMKRLGLSTFFGFDKHFKRAGFKPFLA